MPWNPTTYNKFKSIRYKPFFDLANLIAPEGLHRAIDIGCGTGEQTAILAERFPQTQWLGIDPSSEMLAVAPVKTFPNLTFRQAQVNDVTDDQHESWDLVFSNAALQWTDDHATLFPKLIRRLRPSGQIAIQMPVQKENRLNQLLVELVQEKPFSDYLHGWVRESPLLDMDGYAQLFFSAGLTSIEVIQKMYPITAEHENTLFDFIAGSALIPYLERMDMNRQHLLTETFRARIREAFAPFPAIYPFKRLLLYGRRAS